MNSKLIEHVTTKQAASEPTRLGYYSSNLIPFAPLVYGGAKAGLGGVGGAVGGSMLGTVAGTAAGAVGGAAGGSLIGALIAALSKGRLRVGAGARMGSLVGYTGGGAAGAIGGNLEGGYRGVKHMYDKQAEQAPEYFQGFMAKCAAANLPYEAALQLWNKQAGGLGAVGQRAGQSIARAVGKGPKLMSSVELAMQRNGGSAARKAGGRVAGKAGGRPVKPRPAPQLQSAADIASRRADDILAHTPPAAATPPPAIGGGLIDRTMTGAKNIWKDTVAPQLSRWNKALPQPVQQFNQGTRQGFKELGMRFKGQAAELDAARAARAGLPASNVAGRRFAYATPAIGAAGLGYGALSGD